MAFDPYHKWLGIPPEEQPPHNYRLLAIKPFESDPDVIEAAADRLMAQLKTYQAGKNGALSQQLLNEVAAAKVVLLNVAKKDQYDAALRASLEASSGESSSGTMAVLREIATKRPATAQRRTTSRGPLVAIAAVGLLAVVIVAVAVVGGRRDNEPPKNPQGTARMLGARTSEPELQAKGRADGAGKTRRMPTKDPAADAQPAASVEPSPAVAAQSAASSAPPGRQNARSQTAVSESPSARVADPAKVRGTPTVAAKVPAASPAPGPSLSARVAPLTPGPSAALPGASKPPEPALLPIPGEAAQAESMQAAQDKFKGDYDRAKGPAEKQALARKLLEQSTSSELSAADRFVLLRLASDVAARGNDSKLAFEAIDRTAQAYQVEPLAMKADALSVIARSAKGQAGHKALAEQAAELATEALREDRLEPAARLAKLAQAEAGKARDKEIVLTTRNLARDAQEARRAFAEVESALTKLKQSPDDPDANLAAGRYYALIEGDWDKGLPYLAKGSDTALKALATEDLKNSPPVWIPAAGVAPPDPVPAAITMKLADAWWDFGQQARGKARDNIMLYAGYWYRVSREDRNNGLLGTKVRGRLDQIERLRHQQPTPPLAASPFDAQQARAHQRRWSRYLGMPFLTKNSIGMKFVLIPPGEFQMGSTPREISELVQFTGRGKYARWYAKTIPAEGPRHTVRITKPFYLSIYEVTQGEYLSVMGSNPSGFRVGGILHESIMGPDTSRHPVESVCWEEAVQFCRRMSEMPGERLVPPAYRMPTEAQWEWACRAGSDAPWTFGRDESVAERYAWLAKNANKMTHPVGQKTPNGWGLYDMHGNVWEWVSDWLSVYPAGGAFLVDPVAPTHDSKPVLRGGGYPHGAIDARSACRYPKADTGGWEACGFRVAYIP